MLPGWSTFDSRQAVEEVRGLCEEMRAHVAAVKKERPTFERLVRATEGIDDRLAQVAGPLGNLYASMRTPEIVTAHEEVEKLMGRSRTDTWSDLGFYRAHRAFCNTREYRMLGKEENGADERRVDKKSAFSVQLQTFRDYGVFLPEAKKQRLRLLEEEIEALAKQFDRNVDAALKRTIALITDEAQLSGVPAHVKFMMQKEAEAQGLPGWALSTKEAIRVPILEFADDRGLREQVYRAWATHAPDQGTQDLFSANRPIAERLLVLRHSAARCLWKQNHAERIIEDLMAGSVSNVRMFLNSLRHKVRKDAKEDIARLKKFSKVELGHDLLPWDVEYVKNRFLKKYFGFTGVDLEPYLRFSRVRKTLFSLAEEMYGVKIKERPDVRGWLPHVRFFEVYEHNGNLAGGFYLDPFARVGEVVKESNLWTDCILERRRLNKTEIRLPLVIIHLNLAKLGEEEAQSLSHKDVIGLFHEFGHMLQDVLGKSNFLATGSANIEWDAIEIPSILMENWAWDVEVLSEMARDKKTKRSVPLKLLLAIHRQRPIAQSYGRWSLHEYLERSLIDLTLHSEVPRAGVVERVVRRVRKEVGVLPILPGDQFPDNFPHIFSWGYDACFYSYPLSWRFAAAIRVEHLKTGHSISPIVSRRFRREFLEASRTREAKDNLTAFFGRKLPSAKALLEQVRML